MKDFSNLQSAIIAAIAANGVGAITGPVLQEQLLSMVDKMELSSFEGVATSETTPTTDALGEHFYLAIEEGDYSNFVEELVIETGDIYLIYKMAGESEWTALNLAAGLATAIETISEGKQDALTPGNGVDITDDTISVNVGDGMSFDDNGGLVPDLTTNPATDTTKPVSGQGVVDYIDSQKGAADGIAPLDENGLVAKDDLPTDTMYYEETTNPADADYVDEYQRVLAVLYQAISDAQETQVEMSAAKSEALEAASTAETYAETARNAASSATESATLAQTATTTANAAASAANTAATSANNAASQTTAAVNAATAAAATASSAASDANDAADAATTATTNAENATTAANSATEAANDAATYANTQGTYAKNQIDYAKGDFDSLSDRMDHIDEVSVTLDETTDPTDEEYVDEYQRVLSVLYQAIDDANEVTANAETATSNANNATASANDAASAANSAADAANAAADAANDAGDYANTQGAYAKEQGDYATELITAAKGTYLTLDARLDDMETKEYSFEENTNPASLLS